MLKGYMEELKKIKMLELGEEQALWRQMAAGGEQARARLITSYQPLVFKTAAAFHLPEELLLELVQEGMVGLIEAVERFDVSRGVAFSLFAVHRIRGRMLDYLKTVSSVKQDLCLDTNAPQDGALLHRLADSSAGPEEVAEDNFLVGKVKQVLGCLPEKEQKVLHGLYIDELTPAHIAESISVSPSHIYRLQRQGVRRARGMLSRFIQELKW